MLQALMLPLSVVGILSIPPLLSALLLKFYRPTRTMGRLEYFIWYHAVSISAGFGAIALEKSIGVVLAFGLIFLIWIFIITIITSYRLNDAGDVRQYRAVWASVPIIGYIFHYQLVFVKKFSPEEVTPLL